MGRTVTVSVRGLLTTAVVLLGLLSAYLWGAAGGHGAPARAETPALVSAGEKPRTLTMGGSGEATAVPDQLSFDLEVTLLRPDLATALDEANAKMDRVLSTIGGLGVRRSDVQTTGLSMYPVYDYHSSGPPTLRGYRVSQRAAVLVRELRAGGKVVSAAVATGGNDVRVSDIRLKVGDVDAVLAKARAAAVADARDKAQQYAGAAGLELGDVRTLHEVGPRQRLALAHGYAVADAARAPAAGLAALPIRAGKDTTRVRVQVVWELR
ncbi:SIMPL domain-containing protein [Nocardioides panaciterrulae]|uniref:DUF541 domain-containing protein n=1 Tax=Nocardioides panaciterrulae TaxID=661492 RepID=A0A7Y9E6E1_9ACTN|nr:SIMPL domain-containing protein [Nocardioides panaciterrulae]NYD42071.1 hypothetical protein [Nocardioides panaciterrulae]